MSAQQNQHGLAVCSHSTNASYVIFSVYQNTLPNVADAHTSENARGGINVYKEPSNTANHLEFKASLLERGIAFKELLGFYKGKAEESFIINENDFIKYDIDSLVFDYYNQESILIIDNCKHGVYEATLVYNKGNQERIGYLREVSKRYALTQDCYSYDETQGKYFATVPVNTTVACEVKELGYLS